MLLTTKGVKASLGEWVDLSNGCMCCAVKSEFVQAIEALMNKRDNFDYILIETTGKAQIETTGPQTLTSFPKHTLNL